MSSRRQLTSISLFSGAMGLDLGLELAGFRTLVAADNNPAAIATIRANRPSLPLFTDSVSRLTGAGVRELAGLAKGSEVDLVAGGPPCQSFSTAGKRLSLKDEQKGPLVFEFIRLIGELRPRAFLLENVKGLISAATFWRALPYNNNGKRIDEHYGALFREMTEALKALGYSVGSAVLNAADYGVPQRRERLFVIGYRDGRHPTFPGPTHAESPDLFRARWRPMSEALSSLGQDDSYCTKFSPRKLTYLRLVPPGGNWRSLPENLQKESLGRAFFAKGGRSGFWRRLSFEQPSPTILTEPQNASTSLCHPTEDRPLSVLECAAIQTFPREWRFVGRGMDQYRLIGNAVPVQLGKALGDHLRTELESRARRSRRMAKPRLLVDSAE